MLWALGNIIDKFLLSKFEQELGAPILIFIWSGTNLLFSSLLPLFFPLYFQFSYELYSAMLVGVLWFFASILYIRALRVQEASRIMALISTGPLFVMLMAFLVLGEKLSLGNYFGILLIVVASILISYQRDSVSKKFLLMNGFKPILIAVLLWAITDILQKYSLSKIDAYSILFWSSFSYFFLGAVYGLMNFRLLQDYFKKRQKLGTVFFSQFVSTAARLLFIFSLSVGAVSLVSAMSFTQSFFVLFFASLLSFARPEILREELKKSVLAIKFVAIFLIFLGTLLITSLV